MLARSSRRSSEKLYLRSQQRLAAVNRPGQLPEAIEPHILAWLPAGLRQVRLHPCGSIRVLQAQIGEALEPVRALYALQYPSPLPNRSCAPSGPKFIVLQDPPYHRSLASSSHFHRKVEPVGKLPSDVLKGPGSSSGFDAAQTLISTGIETTASLPPPICHTPWPGSHHHPAEHQ